MSKRTFASICLLCIVSFFILLRLISYIKNLGNFFDTLTPMVRYPFASYEQKMTMKYPKYFPYIQKLKLLTPPNSIIYIPLKSVYPDPMWYISFKAVDEALLYPRKIIQTEETPIKDKYNPSYVVLFNGFPDQKLNIQKIYIFEDSDFSESADKEYDPHVFDGLMGLIQL